MKELRNIQEKLKAPKNQFNEFGKYKYRNAEDILEALKPLLAENKCMLIINDEMVMVGDRVYVKATAKLTNPEGVSESAAAYAREAESKKGMDEAQVTGATSSYARKYALNGLFAIDDGRDADSMDNGTQGATPQIKRTTPQGINIKTAPPVADYGKCSKCGAPNAKSKTTGNTYCSKKCWLSDDPNRVVAVKPSTPTKPPVTSKATSTMESREKAIEDLITNDPGPSEEDYNMDMGAPF